MALQNQASLKCMECAWNARFAGMEASGVNNSSGYLRVDIDGSRFYVHKIIMKILFDIEPVGDQWFEHVNGIKTDNRTSNLRLVSHAENVFAFQGLNSGSSSEYRGVSWYRRDKYWRAEAQHKGKRVSKSGFATPEAAASAAAQVRAQLG